MKPAPRKYAVLVVFDDEHENDDRTARIVNYLDNVLPRLCANNQADVSLIFCVDGCIAYVIHTAMTASDIHNEVSMRPKDFKNIMGTDTLHTHEIVVLQLSDDFAAAGNSELKRWLEVHS